ncbi:MAG: sulfite exporter TauE/SafE family protein [Actinobacteria bacterium]|nr:sulfite exporter TauE/SafE family protein [Actinomycetota bacterium]
MSIAAVAGGHNAGELVVFAVLCFGLAFAGGLAGLVLGNLRLPAAVSFADTVSAGGGANVAVSGVAAFTAAAAHIRAGRVNWRLFGWLAPASLVGGFAGGLLANAIDGDLLLMVIAAVLFYGAYELFNWKPPASAPGSSVSDAPAKPLALTATRDRVVVTVIGLVVGVLGGAVGLILGSLRMPALLRFTAEAPQRLVGSNLAAGVLVGIAGAAGHLTGGSEGFDVALFVVGGSASAPGALLGARLTGRLSTAALVRAIAWIVLVVAVAMTAEALL